MDVGNIPASTFSERVRSLARRGCHRTEIVVEGSRTISTTAWRRWLASGDQSIHVGFASLNAGTTDATTAQAAHAACVKVFSTGGLSGVRRGMRICPTSPPISVRSELPIFVVSANVKSNFDTGLTLKRIGTLNVPVVGQEGDGLPRLLHPRLLQRHLVHSAIAPTRPSSSSQAAMSSA